MIALVISRAWNIQTVNTDCDSGETFTALPANRLATDHAEAETWIIGSPELIVAGYYGGLLNACGCTRKTAAIHSATGALLYRENIVTC